MRIKTIAVTGAAGQIGYSLLFRLAHGDLFGLTQPIALNLIDLPEVQGALEGTAMELEDCAFPLLREIRYGSDLEDLFDKVDCVFLVGAKPRGPGMERADLLQENGRIFIDVGRALNDVASRNVKVLVVGNPCNTNCLIAMHHAPKIPRKNFHAMMRLDQNRAQALLAKKANVPVTSVKKMTVWGNHSLTQVPDFTNGEIDGKKVTQVVKDLHWLQEDFMAGVQKRGAQIITARGKSSAASAASASIDAMAALYTPTPVGDWYTSAVVTDERPYGLEKDLIFGLPCRTRGDGEYEIVTDLPWDFFIREKIAVTQKELMDERECIKGLLK